MLLCLAEGTQPMGAYADLIKDLKDKRSNLVTEMKTILAPAVAEKRKVTKDEQERWDAKNTEAEELTQQIGRFEAQEKAEQRAADSRRETGDTGDDPGAAGGRFKVGAEPQVYGRGSGHSYFLDQARATLGVGDGDGGVEQARSRQSRHEAELRVDMPKRIEARRRDADRRMEEALTGGGYDQSNAKQRRMARREQRLYERFLANGGQVFESRAISRTDGQGGYFVPPLWLVDDYVPYLRAGRTFADLWRNLPLPAGTDSINIPRVTLGTATGTQPGDGAPVPGRDIKDNFVNARIMTVAGQQDAAIQLLDQSPVAYDEILFGDLTADYNMQLSAQLMIGAGFPQLNGLFPTGVLYGSAIGTTGATPYGFYTAATGTGTSQWTGANSFYMGSAQLLSQISRNRFLPPSALISNDAAWYALAASTDTQGRPLVVPAQQGVAFNEVAGDEGMPVSEGPVGRILGRPWSLDPNIPLTFGGTGAIQPSIGTISNGSTAAVPGSGGTSANANVYTPLIAGVWNDLFLWEGEIRSRTLSEVLSGTLQVRFQLYAYNASMPNRYQDASGNPLSYGNVNSIGTLAAALSMGASGGLVGF